MSYTNKRHTYYEGITSDPSSTFQYTQQTNEQRRKHVTFGPYILGSTLGEGEFGKVKLGWPKNFSNNSTSAFDFPKQVAVKLIKRDTISNDYKKEVKIYREINALKHLSHPNIVKLEEVLQNSRYIGIVLEYACGGEFYKYIQKKRRLKETNACRLFSQLISGVHYIHSKGLVHRDLKLENLLLDKNENLVITDFGFVNEFCSRNELMKTSCGSPCYAAPELVVSTKPYEARKADIWSCGVILYAMLAGYLPWDDDPKNPEGSDIGRLYNYICSTPLKFPDYILPIPRDLLRRILVSDPKRRINLKQIEKHGWLKSHSSFLSITPDEWDKLHNTHSVFRLEKPKARYGSRPQSSCSTSSMGSRSDKRDSLIIDSTLLTFPAPPQESQNHIITRPTSIPSDQRLSPIRRSNRHNRSNSAASIALQAVVNADREYVLSHEQSLPSAQKTRQLTVGNISPSLSPPSVVNSGDVMVESTQLKRNTTSGNNVTLYLEKELLGTAQTNKVHLNNANSSQNDQYNKPKTQNSLKYTKNFHRTSSSSHTKPRPTSYHPGSYTTTSYNSNRLSIEEASDKTKSTASSQTLNQRETSPFDSAPYLAPDTCITSCSSIESSPKLITNGSFSLAKPSVDLQIVSGDLIKYKGDAEGATRTYDEKYKQRRKSLRYSGIFNDISCDTVTEESDDLKVPESAVAQAQEQETLDTTKAGNANQDALISVKTQVNLPLERSLNDQVNINLERSLNETESVKKRFSFFSLYSYNTSKSSLYSSIDSKRKPSPPSQRRPKKDDTHINPRTSSTTTSNVPTSHKLKSDQSLQTIAQDERIPELKKAVRTERASIMVSEVRKANTDNKENQYPEQSTAKRVLGFFKRRSMRV
ncbi:protein kinase FRK1 [Saccharomyces eubayanus]|uniref:protein kinase FRK1 n=1 Tax=Saccharomyces eubayanus TaxID=1080349 RepID=UPI0006C11F11|nr:FRK1-like protein [Saccharomyces eubayanus]KOG96176.1 FRK1-like protein [Saccharomyces eubayanus]